MNPDFRDFMQRVKKDIEKDEIYKEKYDKVVERDKLLSSIEIKKSTKT